MVFVHRFEPHDTPYPLGRQVEHDERSRAFAFEAPEAPTRHDTVWPDSAPVLDQKATSSCTGNASAQLLNTVMFAPAREAKNKRNSWLTEADALSIYSLGTHLDGFGPSQYYPPHDDGSSGLGVAKAMQQMGYIDRYSHCFSFTSFLAAIQTQPVIVGTDWTTPMFDVDSRGFVHPGPLNDQTIQGGHEYLCRGVSFTGDWLLFRNSWGPRWGGGPGIAPGEFKMALEDFKSLLADSGDVIVPHGVGVS